MNDIVLSKQQMQEMDRRTIHELGIPSRVLMEAAGAKCAEIIRARYFDGLKGKVLILCGFGNNGGDGLVIARHLHDHCRELLIALIGNGNMSPDSRQNLDACKALAIPVVQIANRADLTQLGSIRDIGLIIDAVYGIGFRGELPEVLHALVDMCEPQSCPVVAIDIASGIESDTGVGYALKADLTLAIEFPKLGHILENGRKYTGELVTVPIGIPRKFLPEPCARLTDAHNVEYPIRYPDAHKGSYGKVLIIGGSEGYLGSVNLAAHAALRAGAGLVYLCSRKALQPYYSNHPGEVMFRPIPEDEQTGLPDQAKLTALLGLATTIVIGPGLGLDEYALSVLTAVLKQTQVPTIVDADAITLISRNPDLNPYLSNPRLVITPHKAEFARIAGIDISEIQSDPISCLARFVAETDSRVLLKGFTTIYKDMAQTMISISGNDGLATGGSGDVLAGIIAAFSAQNLDLAKAAIAAAYLMGATAELLAEQRSSRSILPRDIIDQLFKEA